jgi:hypothetical protein
MGLTTDDSVMSATAPTPRNNSTAWSATNRSTPTIKVHCPADRKCLAMADASFRLDRPIIRMARTNGTWFGPTDATLTWYLVMSAEVPPPHNVMPFTGRGRADDQSNHNKRSAATVQCSGGLFLGRAAALSKIAVEAQRAQVRFDVLATTRPRVDVVYM